MREERGRSVREREERKWGDGVDARRDGRAGPGGGTIRSRKERWEERSDLAEVLLGVVVGAPLPLHHLVVHLRESMSMLLAELCAALGG